MRFVTPAALALLTGLALGAPAGARTVSPSVRITGISVDQVDVPAGTTITYHPNRPENACYDIGGADQAPPQVTVVFFLHETGIPNGAPTTLDVTTPWDSQSRPEKGHATPSFGHVWFPNLSHGVAAIFGGTPGGGNHYTFDDEGTRGDAFNGTYTVTTTVKVDGRVLRAHGQLHVDCDD